ncbi:NOT2 NOT3 NOT5 family [Brachionus plicatilis]|uniref:NOT2 NOT3 NOT5 family n=1 Tax=Brachionus plicatilis TaxID=10195 RepID=A0A3M7RJ00_BRAPC|nr:NOT2 NOT3 NOT5 family [Brachionus plicatilis]
MNNTCYLNSGLDNVQRDFYQTQTSPNCSNILEILSFLNQSQIPHKQNINELQNLINSKNDGTLMPHQALSMQFNHHHHHFENSLDHNNNFHFFEESANKFSDKIIHQRNQHHQPEPLQRNISKDYILSQLKAQQRLKQVQQCFREKQNLSTLNNSNDYLRHAFSKSTNSLPKSHYPQQNKVSDKIEILNDGNVKNVPPNYLLDQFGLIGLVMMLKINESNKDLSLIMGQGDESNTITQSVSPKSENDSVLNIPNINAVNHLEPVSTKNGVYNLAEIRKKLPDVNSILKNAHDDLLFYFFYMCSADCYQILASKLLTAKGWFFNKELNSWLKSNPQNKKSYLVFDYHSWTIQIKGLN